LFFVTGFEVLEIKIRASGLPTIWDIHPKKLFLKLWVNFICEEIDWLNKNNVVPYVVSYKTKFQTIILCFLKRIFEKEMSVGCAFLVHCVRTHYLLK
jgi:hypothetical protein